jgi:hypothetical protein
MVTPDYLNPDSKPRRVARSPLAAKRGRPE